MFAKLWLFEVEGVWLYHYIRSTNCECYKKLRLAAVMAAAVATTLAAAIMGVATMLVAIQWQHAVLYISSCIGSLG